MELEPESGPPAADPSGTQVKLAEDVPSVPAAWLDDAHVQQADAVDRLVADQDMVLRLALAGYTGSDWEYFSTELARYGMAVIGGWMYRGVIFERCKAKGYGGLPDLGRPFARDEINELVGETVAKALVHFRADVLMQNRWDARKGASLRTYFVGQCLIRFSNIYRRWWRNEARSIGVLADADTLSDFAPRVPGPEARALDRQLVQAALNKVKDPRVREAMMLTAQGYTQVQIAGRMGVTVKAVERMLANARTKLREGTLR